MIYQIIIRCIFNIKLVYNVNSNLKRTLSVKNGPIKYRDLLTKRIINLFNYFCNLCQTYIWACKYLVISTYIFRLVFNFTNIIVTRNDRVSLQFKWNFNMFYITYAIYIQKYSTISVQILSWASVMQFEGSSSR